MAWVVWVVSHDNGPDVFASQDAAEDWIRRNLPQSKFAINAPRAKRCELHDNSVKFELSEKFESLIELSVNEVKIEYNFGQPMVIMTAHIMLTYENQRLLERLGTSRARLIVDDE